MTWADQVFVGNTYTIRDAAKTDGRYRQIDEKVVQASQVDSSIPRLPPTPPRVERKVFEVPPGATSQIVQKAIEAAAMLGGQHPVVHLPMGKFAIDHTLAVPAGSDVQLIGDGAAETASVLTWSGPAGQPLLLLNGPSHAVVRDLSIEAGEGVGVRVTDCDQGGAKIYGNGVNVTGGSPTNKGDAGLLVDRLDHADVLMENLQGGTYLRNWVRVVGGPLLAAGKPADGHVAVLCGATGTSDAPYAVRDGGRLLVRSVYHEMSGDAPQALLLDNSGSLTIDATRFSYATTADRPLIALSGFRGRFALLTSILLPVNSHHSARIRIAGDGSGCEALCMADQFIELKPDVNAKTVWTDESRPPARAAMLRCNMNFNLKETGVEKKHSGFGALDDQGVADDAFIRRMLQPLRDARVWLPSTTAADATDLRFERVIVSAGKDARGIELSADKTPPN